MANKFQPNQRVNFIDRLFNTVQEVSIICYRGESQCGSQRYEVKFDNGMYADLWDRDLSLIPTYSVDELAFRNPGLS